MHPSVPIKTIKELIALARANPNKLNFGSAGTGGLGHLAGELFKLQTGVTFTHIPYKGSGPVMNALLSGEVDSSFSSLVPSMPHVKAGRLHAIAVTTPKRSPTIPDVPTVGETVPGYDVTHWYGMWGPKGIPREIVTRWNQEVAKVLNTDAMKKWLAQEGLVLAGGPPEEYLNRIRSDVEKWKKVVKVAKIVIAK
jgi:tripartite-type tricarboxylate transporter receptor subunit TctC